MSVRLERDYSQITKNVKIAMNKSLLKEFNNNAERVVYLENGNEFQIQIFNDQTTEIGAKIYVNDELIGNSYLVIKPGERVWLDRYLDKARKFKFSTYEVNGNNDIVKQAIKKNGVVRVELYRKQSNYFGPIQITQTDPQPIYWTTSSPYSVYKPIVDENTILGSSVNICQTLDLDFGSSASTAVNTLFSGFVESEFDSGEKTRCKSSKNSNNKTETGRIQEGGHSNQEFNYVDMSFEYYPFDTEIIHIMPKSIKPTYPTDLQKVYCHNCGRKLKAKFNFCPFCGAKL